MRVYHAVVHFVINIDMGIHGSVSFFFQLCDRSLFCAVSIQLQYNKLVLYDTMYRYFQVVQTVHNRSTRVLTIDNDFYYQYYLLSFRYEILLYRNIYIYISVLLYIKYYCLQKTHKINRKISQIYRQKVFHNCRYYIIYFTILSQ